jgi:hypothetical protein
MHFRSQVSPREWDENPGKARKKQKIRSILVGILGIAFSTCIVVMGIID